MKQTSHSKCEVFDECPLRGYFSHILHLEPDLVKAKDYAFVGSYVHTSIEKWFLWYIKEDVDFATLVEPGKHFSHVMEEIYKENQYTITDEIDDESIVTCLNNFIDYMSRRIRYLKYKNLAHKFLPVAIEKEYTKEINGVPFHGYVDAIFEDEQIWVMDWKTNKDGHISDGYVRQGTRYAMLVEDDFGTKINEAFFINLRSIVNTQKARVLVTEEMKEKQKLELKKLWDLMNGTQFPKSPTSKPCFFCDWKITCKRYPLTGVTIDPNIKIEATITETVTVEAAASNATTDAMTEWW